MDSCKFIDVGAWQCFMFPIVILFILLGMGTFGGRYEGVESKWVIPVPSIAFILSAPVLIWAYIDPIMKCKGDQWIEYVFRFWS